MWIKWKYNDHGHGDFKELELPDNLDGEESVEDWICESGLVPTWSERFMKGRIKWKKLDLSDGELKNRKIKSLTGKITYHKRWMETYQTELNQLNVSDRSIDTTIYRERKKNKA